MQTTPLMALAQAMTATAHPRALGLEVISVEKGRARLSLPYRAELVGEPETGVIAGGAITALLDHVCGVAVMTALAAPAPIATLDLRIDYMRPAAVGRIVLAEAHCYKVTHSIAFVRATAYEDSADDPIASASAAFILTGTQLHPWSSAPA
jgi:uncharacterized protein (TIGR00369 family)